MAPILSTDAAMLEFFRKESAIMANEYSLADVLERIYHNKLALEAALMEVTLWAERKNAAEVGENVRGGASHNW